MNYYAIRYSDYLEHHGILGQKWGIRRFQNKDGSLTPAGEQRYNTGKKKHSKLGKRFVDRIAKTYKEQYDISDEEAQERAEKYAKYIRNVAIGAGVAVGVAAGVYIARQVGMNYADNVIKAGTTLQTLKKNPGHMAEGSAFYAAYTKTDKEAYKGLFAKDQTLFGPIGDYKQKIETTAQDNMKIAGNHTAKKVFKDLMNNDPQFAKAFNENKYVQDTLKDRGKKSVYDVFNTAAPLDHKSESAKIMQDKFYGRLKDMGYQGVADVNDRKYSGFDTHAAIIFDNKNLKKDASGKLDMTINQLTQEEEAKGKNVYLRTQLLRYATSPGTVATGSLYVSGMLISAKNNKEAKELESKKKKLN